ncbi:MAG TPA: putative lipid II flippase FtsW [Patescibacteria group bacterium]|jgi:cell division protein FtsW|nr:putative lipid II flippase FtsW [Patescibacteria group bacterium]
MAKTKKPVDYLFLSLLGGLLVVGLIMLWSASTVESQQNFGNTSYYFTHQLFYGIGIGLLAMYILSRIDYHVWKKFIPFAIAGTLIALALVKVPGLGFGANGATRWIDIGPLFFQPSEAAKLALIMYLAGWMSERDHHKGFAHSVLPPVLIIGLYCLLILWQPDLGTMISLVMTAAIMLFVGGIRLRYFAWLTAGGVSLMLILIKLEPYRVKRITAFLNKSVDPLGIGYQINQALIGIGSGGWFGYGYGHSRQKYSYLPEAINDSIFAVMAEELGFIRVLLILLLFAWFIVRGIQISYRAPDLFGKMLAVGIIGSIAASVVVNISAITGLLPLTGIPLPFFSYGSSAMIMTLAGCGIVLNISRQSK